MSPARLFRASCVALVATAMSFAIRGDIMGDFERVFGLTATEVGWISGAAFWGFGLSILFGGPLVDALGMRMLARLAAAGHIGGTLLTIVAPNFTVLFTATLVIGVANGLVEAFVNPLVATLYPERQDDQARRPARLVPRRHRDRRPAGVPVHAGRVSAGRPRCCCCWCRPPFTRRCSRGESFPPTESAAAGVSLGGMVTEIGRPLFLLVWVCMWLTAATELGPGQWYANIFNEVMQQRDAGGHHPARLGERHHVRDAAVLRAFRIECRRRC